MPLWGSGGVKQAILGHFGLFLNLKIPFRNMNDDSAGRLHPRNSLTNRTNNIFIELTNNFGDIATQFFSEDHKKKFHLAESIGGN